MPAGELGSIVTGVYVDVLTRLGASDLRVTGQHVNVITPVTLLPATPQAFTGAAATAGVTAGTGSFVAGNAGTPQDFSGVAATVSNVAGLGSFVVGNKSPQTFTGVAAPAAVSAGAGTFVAGAKAPQAFTGTAATLSVTAGVGAFVAGAPLPRIIEKDRLHHWLQPGDTTFFLEEPHQAGDVVVVVMLSRGLLAPATPSGLGGTWQAASVPALGTHRIYYTTDRTSAGTITMTSPYDPEDTLWLVYVIRGADPVVSVGYYETNQPQPQGRGQLLIASAVADTGGGVGDLLDLPASGSKPSPAAWTADAPYTMLDAFGAPAAWPAGAAYAVPPTTAPYFPDTNEAGNSWDFSLARIVVGTFTEPQNFTGKGAPRAVTAGRGSFGAIYTSGIGSTLTVDAVTKPKLIELGPVELEAGSVITVGEVLSAVELADVTLKGGATLSARPYQASATDPRTGLDQWRYVVTDLQGAPLGELVDLEHDTLQDGVNEPATMSFTMALDDAAYGLVKPIVRQCQVWQGNQLLLRGPILPGNPSEDGATVTHTVHDPSWWWRDGRKRIGWVPKTNLLRNGDFTQGLAYWTRGFDKGSIPAAPPTVQVVADDFTDGGKAAEIHGVESVTETKAELESSAVYWPNRPYSYEPLAAGFRPGGGAAVDAVANDMPTTAGLKVSIVGHTANDGTGNGMELSLRRALAAKARVQALRPAAVITTKGVGFYDPNPKYPIDAQAQRRVVISYSSTTTISGKSKQWLRQTVTVTQPKSAAYGLELVGAAWLKVTDDWSIEDANMVSVRVVARRQDRPTTIWADESSSISDTDPVDRWLKATASVTIPADGRPYLVDVYLYAPAALTRYTRAVLEPQELLYFWGKDQALIVKGIVEHMQDPRTMLGVTWPITVGTRTPLTGVARDREYPHSARMPIDTALEEFPSLYRGLDIDVLTTPTETTVATFYPQQGQTVDYPLVLGGNVSRAAPATTRDVASLIIAQAQDSSSARDEAYAGDKRALGGLMLQSLITAEQDTPLNELDETAANELSWSKVDTAAYWLDVDPESVAEVLAETAKGDTVRLLLDGPLQLDELVRIVKREIHPDGLRLMVARQEA